LPTISDEVLSVFAIFWYISDMDKNHRTAPSESQKASAKAIQDRFFAQIGDLRSLLGLLNHLPNNFFFMKDHRSHMIWVSTSTAERLNPFGDINVVGKNDYEFFPKHVADQFVADDQSVLRTGKPMVDRIEVFFNSMRELEWAKTTKFPILNTRGNPIGIFGFVANSARHEGLPVAEPRISQAIAFIEKNCRNAFSVEEIADAAGVSSRHLLRLFRDTLGIGINQFIMKVKVQAASDALARPEATIANVSSDFGFCDQSAFTRQFRIHTGTTPAAFRRRYGQSHNGEETE
jgi:AraC-like DNA-binding protein